MIQNKHMSCNKKTSQPVCEVCEALVKIVGKSIKGKP